MARFEIITNMTKESFASLFEESLQASQSVVGSVVKGNVVAVDSENAFIDVGLKSEGRIPLSEFSVSGQPSKIAVGDVVDVYVEKMENRDGEVGLSRERAKREETWTEIEKLFAEKKHVKGVIFGRVRGGFTVNIMGITGFLPGSQVDVRPVRNMDSLMNIEQDFEILKMDRLRGNIVVSRRSILEETFLEERAKIMENLSEGKIVEGVVKNITDYGAFVDLGGIDGLLHVTDISWKRINHPSEILHVGDTVKVQIIRFNQETKRISLGMKQMKEDPWTVVASKYTLGSRFKGRITNIADYGAFVELEEGIEGLVHISEMSWTKKNVHPGKIVSTSQEVEVQVLEIDAEKRRISLGIKQCKENPWEKIAMEYPINTIVEGEVKNITDFGIFIGITEDIDGMIHMSDISWQQSGEASLAKYKKGDSVKAIVLGIDSEKERISLGIKQLSDNPNEAKDVSAYKKNDVVTVTIKHIGEAGLEVTVGENEVPGFIKKSELSIDRSEQRLDRFASGEKVDAQIVLISHKDGRLNLSIKALELAQEKEAMKQYGSTDSGATLGDILGKALDVEKK